MKHRYKFCHKFKKTAGFNMSESYRRRQPRAGNSTTNARRFVNASGSNHKYVYMPPPPAHCHICDDIVRERTECKDCKRYVCNTHSVVIDTIPPSYWNSSDGDEEVRRCNTCRNCSINYVDSSVRDLRIEFIEEIRKLTEKIILLEEKNTELIEKLSSVKEKTSEED